MTIDKYKDAGKIIDKMDRYQNEIEKLTKATSMPSPYGYLEITTQAISPIRIALDADTMKRCIWLVNDIYLEKYQNAQKELEDL